jgi:signal transduction histidine kinase
MRVSATSQTTADQRIGALPLHAIVLLGVGFGVAGLASAGMALWLSHTRVALSTLLTLSVGAALLVGLGASALLLARLAQLDRTLARLAEGEPVAAPTSAWPLSQLLWRAGAVNDRIAQGAERERQAAAYHDEVMRQVSEAAAREERNRLARELHDSIKQQLFSIGVSAAAARARAGEGGASVALADIERGAREAQVEMTALLQQLRPAPLENVGLVAALRDQCEALGYRTGAEVSVTIGALPAEDRLPLRAQEQLFRMAQEALANIARHARARHVWLRLEQDGDAMLLEIRDDGQGFDTATARGGMGLSNLRERARALGAEAQIESAPGHGSTISIRAPLVEPLRQTPEELARQAALAHIQKAGLGWLSWSRFALQLAGGLILFSTPFWSVALALAVSAACYLAGRRAQSEARLLGGRSSEAELALGHRARECLAWLLLLLALCVWYLPVSVPRVWSSGMTLEGMVAGSALLGLLGLLTWERWRRTTGRYYRALVPAPRHIAIQRRLEETGGQAGTVAFIFVLGLIFGGWSPVFPPHTPTQWSDTASVALLALLGAFLPVELLLCWRWRRTLDTERGRRRNGALV